MSKMSHTLKKFSAVIGMLGILFLVFAWFAEFHGFVLGFESRVWYSSSMIFLLIAIWFKLGAILYKGE